MSPTFLGTTLAPEVLRTIEIALPGFFIISLRLDWVASTAYAYFIVPMNVTMSAYFSLNDPVSALSASL